MSLSLLDDLPVRGNLWPDLARFSEQLADLLGQTPCSSPVLISGDWGVGKTSLLLSVADHLKQKGEIKPVWFDAWRYENESALLPALVRVLWESWEDKHTLAARSLLKAAWEGAWAVTRKAAPTLAAMTGLGWATVLVDYASDKDVGEALKSAFKPALEEPEKDATQKLWEDFHRLVEKVGEGKPVIVLVDDLDRCSPESAVSLLDALRFLISGFHAHSLEQRSQGDCRFVVALDKTVLGDAVAKKFSDLSSFEANRYLEKIFPITFAMPLPGKRDVDRLVEELLQSVKGRTNDDQANRRGALSETLSDPEFRNPRLVKRSINRFYLVMHFENQSGSRHQTFEGYRSLAHWIAATERWPLLRRLLDRNPEPEFWEQFKECISSSLGEKTIQMPDDPDTTELLRQKGTIRWLKNRMFLSLDDQLKSFQEAERRLSRWGL